MVAPPRRFPPLYPGDVRRCPNGCPHKAVENEDEPRMPDWGPDCGYWLTVCIFCGWVARYVLRHGDREEDICWIVCEDVPAAQVQELRVWGLGKRLELGMGPWPAVAGEG